MKPTLKNKHEEIRRLCLELGLEAFYVLVGYAIWPTSGKLPKN